MAEGVGLGVGVGGGETRGEAVGDEVGPRGATLLHASKNIATAVAERPSLAARTRNSLRPKSQAGESSVASDELSFSPSVIDNPLIGITAARHCKHNSIGTLGEHWL